jgi:hypothetical protein
LALLTGVNSMRPALGWVVALSLLFGACQSASPAQPQPSASVPPSSAARAPAVQSGLTQEKFASLFRELSEPDRYFFSDNHVSNETSYLEVAPILE